MQRSISTNSLDGEIKEEPVVQPKPAKATKRSRSTKGCCSCKNECKEGRCGCRKQAGPCNGNCKCALIDCGNPYNGTSPKRHRSMEDEITSTVEENKENKVMDMAMEDEVIPCTPQQQRLDQALFFNIVEHCLNCNVSILFQYKK